MKDKYFLDTNIFVYALDQSNLKKREIAQMWVLKLSNESCSVISYQVIQEFINVTLKKGFLNSKYSTESFMNRFLFPIWKINPSPELFERILDLKKSINFHFYDALIVVAALEAGCKFLISEDLQHGQQIDELKIINPFMKMV